MPILNPLSSYVRGQSLQLTRQVAYGTYVFPLTFQCTDSALKLAVDRKKMPFNYGDFIHGRSTPVGREVTISGDVGTGVVGISGTQIITTADLELERAAIAVWQSPQGATGVLRQPLFCRAEQYCLAFLTEFNVKPFTDGGMFRYANYELKFVADDPRFYSSAAAHLESGNANGSSSPFSFLANHAGNVNSFPIVTFTAAGSPSNLACVAPYIQMSIGANLMRVQFSKLSMYGGDKLVVDTDPRPEHRARGALYTKNGAATTNGMQYIAPTDFINNYDFTMFFPFIPPLVNSTISCGTGSGDVGVSVEWQDTWL